MSTLTVERSATAELALTVSQNGGVSGLAAVVAVRDGASYLDWFDMTFKAAGWTTRQAAMIEIGDGHYRHSLDLAAITNLPSATVALSAEYATTGAVAASAHDLLLVVESFLDLPTAAAVASVQADADDIQTRLPAALVSGRIDASVGAMAAGVLTASAIATNALDADALATDAVAKIVAALNDPTAAAIADAVWQEVLAAHETTAGSAAQAIAVLRNRIRVDFAAGPPRQLVVYAQDGVTELYRAELTTDNGDEVLAFFGVQHERGAPT